MKWCKKRNKSPSIFLGVPCDKTWKKFNGYCYKEFEIDAGAKWQFAQDYCKAISNETDVNLVSIMSQDEQDFIVSNFTYV